MQKPKQSPTEFQMQVAWPGTREGAARSQRTGIPLGECISRMDQGSPASRCRGINQVPGH